ncbi:peroxinectin A-like [Clytia hemisphaerica]|uniref:Peroxidase n=1 Tax=Clytia hemisphaerica TaxID=252671 RepID=A0A7M6DK04_9CNID
MLKSTTFLLLVLAMATGASRYHRIEQDGILDDLEREAYSENRYRHLLKELNDAEQYSDRLRNKFYDNQFFNEDEDENRNEIKSELDPDGTLINMYEKISEDSKNQQTKEEDNSVEDAINDSSSLDENEEDLSKSDDVNDVDLTEQQDDTVLVKGFVKRLQLGEPSRILKTIPTWPKEWKVSFNIKPYHTRFNNWRSIIHFTTGSSRGPVGSRIPAVWFIPKTHKLYIVSHVNDKENTYTSSTLPTYRFTRVQISQRKQKNGKYIYQIKINGIKVRSKVNRIPREFNNVLIYAPDKWSKSSLASLRNFKFEGYLEPNLPASNIVQKNSFAKCQEPRRRTDCSKASDEFRTFDGTCNNKKNPKWGATETPLSRIIDADYVDGITTPRGFPNTSPVVPTANQVSEAVFQVETTNNGNGNGLAVSFMTFGQFLDHDLTEVQMNRCQLKVFGRCDNIKESFVYPCLPILFNDSSPECTTFSQSETLCPENDKRPGIRQMPNHLSAFIDASQIYGNSDTSAERLRDQNDRALMAITEDGLMPIVQIPGFAACSVFKDLLGERTTECRTLGGCSLVGDVRGDENIALHSMHTLWIREHNRIAKRLRKINPKMDDEEIYQTARKIVGGIWANLVYEEYLPALVQVSPYKKYKADVDPSISNSFAAAAFRYGHSLVPNSFQQNNASFNPVSEPISLQNAFFNREPVNFRGIEPTLFGITGNQSNEVDNNFAKGIARRLFVRPGEGFHYDLLALNVQRGRDHGLPTYGAYRKFCGLPTLNSWADARSCFLPKAVQAFKKIYKSPNDIDLFAAGISEIHLSNSELGPTFNCLIKKQFEDVRDGDRFFYRNKNVFTRNQLKAIEKVTFASVLCANLKNIVCIQPNALRVPNDGSNRRITCDRIPKLNLGPWRQ